MSLKKNIFITELKLQNFATFETQTIQFSNGMNTIIGETGSGKSLIMEALKLAFGQRADKKIIRKGTKFACVEVTLETENSEIHDELLQLGFPTDSNQITIKRILFENESSKCHLNHYSCSISQLVQFTRKYIDLVGQFENQKLLSDDYQIQLIDHYAGLDQTVQTFSKLYEEFIDLIDRKKQFEDIEKSGPNRSEFLEFQIKEITDFNPSVEDELNFIRIKNEFVNKEKKISTLNTFLQILRDSEEFNVIDQLKKIERTLEKSKDFLSDLSDFEILNVVNNLEDFCSRIDRINEEQQHLDINEILERIDFYQKLKRKHRCETSELAAILESLNNEFKEIENTEKRLEKITHEIDDINGKLLVMGKTLHEARVHAAKKLSSEISKVVHQLNMPGAMIYLQIQPKSLCKTGLSKIEIEAETNIGEGRHKLTQVASGGELSRILLAFRKILSGKDSISIFLFDEIDAGIGGETATCIGKTLSDVAKSSQVIAITHLPQMAKFAENLILVKKEIDHQNNRTKSLIETPKNKLKILHEMSGHVLESNV